MTKKYKPLKIGGYYKEVVLKFFGSTDSPYRYVKILTRKKTHVNGLMQYVYKLKTENSSHLCGNVRCQFKLNRQHCADNNITCYWFTNVRSHAAMIPVSKLEGLIHVGE